MVNLSRLYNSAARRALTESYLFLTRRKTFGKVALEHPLVRKKLQKLFALNIGQFYLTWKAIDTLDQADNGDNEAAQLIRFLTPMAKRYTAENSVFLVRESMELMGGMGYIEDGIMPKIMRDVLVLLFGKALEIS
ncbi:MAG: hypothetical protein LAT68_12635 [Cyclobacteriaceae bacterium]|nr:hypothetical protein [Cyclobacteriaceae bacterium]MCH8517165.1 hypothetical protein [Cyclobacteriaceae bacterium]